MARDAAPACVADGGEKVQVTGVADDWSLDLADGRHVRLAGIDPVAPTAGHPARADDARMKLRSWLADRAAVLVPLEAGVDRWGRSAGVVFAAGGPAAEDGEGLLSVAFAMVDAGLARGRPEPGFSACWAALLAAEARAREAGLGLWGDPYYAVRASGGPVAGVDRTGTMVIVEGLVTRVGQGRSRVFIGLGRGEDAVTVSVARRNLFILGQRGLDDTRLVGLTLRVRGELDDRGGPSIDVTDPAQVEVVGR
jgi:endonuclease YncB( thermonuclease family)